MRFKRKYSYLGGIIFIFLVGIFLYLTRSPAYPTAQTNNKERLSFFLSLENFVPPKKPSYQIESHSYQYKKNYSIPYLQIKGMEDKKIQKKLNQLLKENAYEWTHNLDFGSKYILLSYRPLEPEITYQTEEYLSIRYPYIQTRFVEKLVMTSPYISITLDMKNGERLGLDDLILLDPNFLSKFYDKKAVRIDRNCLVSSIQESEKEFQSWGKDLSYSEWKDLYQELSINETERKYLIEGNLSFNLTPEGISFENLTACCRAVLRAPYIKDYLIRDPWKFHYAFSFQPVTIKDTQGNTLLKSECVQIQMPDNLSLQEKINQTLYQAAYGWIEQYKESKELKSSFLEKYTPLKPEVTFCNEDYFSIQYPFRDLEKEFDFDYFDFYLCVTVNLKTGERIYLNELLEYDSHLTAIIKDKNNIQILDTSSNRHIREELNEMQLSQLEPILKEWFEESSQDEVSYLEEKNMAEIPYKMTYTITPRGFIFYLGREGGNFLVKKESLKDFLKQPIWHSFNLVDLDSL